MKINSQRPQPKPKPKPKPEKHRTSLHLTDDEVFDLAGVLACGPAAPGTTWEIWEALREIALTLDRARYYEATEKAETEYREHYRAVLNRGRLG